MYRLTAVKTARVVVPLSSLETEFPYSRAFIMTVSLQTENLDWLARGTTEIFPDRPDSDNPNENIALLLSQSDRPLRIKLGIDPTSPNIHLGHSLTYRKLRAFQDAGHTAVVIIGDVTAQIGDPTGRSEVRSQLSAPQVKENAAQYLDQLRPILDFDTPGRLEIRHNSEWLADLTFAKIQQLLSTMTVGQMLAKEGFADRYSQEIPIYLHEFLYPLMQGYDSVMVEADVELGGTDQKFNIAVGRDLQRYFGKKTPQFGLLMPILLGINGKQKMSKSLGNYVGLREDPLSMYQKLQNIPDSVVSNYFELLTDFPLDKLPEDARERQILLAKTIVSQYHGEEAAEKAAAGKEETIPEYSLSAIEFPAPLYYILNVSGLCKSSGDGKRQIKGGAVRLDGDRISDVDLKFDSADILEGKVLQVGKKKFVKFR